MGPACSLSSPGFLAVAPKERKHGVTTLSTSPPCLLSVFLSICWRGGRKLLWSSAHPFPVPSHVCLSVLLCFSSGSFSVDNHVQLFPSSMFLVVLPSHLDIMAVTELWGQAGLFPARISSVNSGLVLMSPCLQEFNASHSARTPTIPSSLLLSQGS